MSATGTAGRDAAAGGLAAGFVCLVAAAVVVRTQEGPAGGIPAGLAAGLGAVLGLSIVGAAGVSLLRRHDRWSGPADRVTLGRAVLAAGCAVLAVPVVTGVTTPRGWALVALLVPALALDAVDGAVARRTGTATAAGGRLDGEMDAALLLVASLAASRSVGVWVLAIGLMRYAFFAAGAVRPALRGRLAYSRFRRQVAGVQGGMLATALAPVVPVAGARTCAGVALVLLTISFGRDVVHLERRHRRGDAGGADALPGTAGTS